MASLRLSGQQNLRFHSLGIFKLPPRCKGYFLYISETLLCWPHLKGSPAFVTEQGGLISAYRNCSLLGWLAQRLRMRLASSLLSLDSLLHTACAHGKPGKDWISQLSLHTGDMLSELGPVGLTELSHSPYRNKGRNPEQVPI